MISPAFPPDLGWDGPARACYELALSLKAAGHELEVISFSTTSEGTVSQDGLIVHRVKPSHDLAPFKLIQGTTPLSRYILNASTSLWKKFLERHSHEPFDIVDTSVLVSESFIPAMLGTVPVIARVFDTAPEYIEQCYRFAGNSAYALDRELSRALRRTALLFSDCLVVSSTVMADEIRSEISDVLLPVECIPPVIDTQRFCPGEEKALDTGGRTTLLVRGRVKDSETQALIKSTLLKVVQEKPDLCVAVAAEDVDSEEREEDVKALLKAEGIDCDLTINSKISRALMPQILRSADICFAPSTSSLNPYVWLDAIACGSALVAVEEKHCPGYLTDGESALTFKPGDSENAARAILDLLNDESGSRGLRERARRHAIEKFDRASITDRTEKLYSEQILSITDRNRSRERARRMAIALDEWQRLAGSYEKMLYDQLYVSSFSFKLNHWLGRLSSRGQS